MYTGRCVVCADENKQDTDLPRFSEKLRRKVLKRIYNQFNVKQDIDPDLFSFTLDLLDKAVETGFGSVNNDFLKELKYNNAVFAAFKTHRQQNDLARELTGEDGKLRSFDEFRKATAPVLDSYNGRWLKTEYDTAVKSARTAARFKEFEKDKDLFPNLKWLRSRAVEPRQAHVKYYNNVRQMEDAWWKTHYPGCVYGCQCDATNTADPVTHQGEHPVNAIYDRVSAEPEVSPGLDRNPATTGSIFTDNHPYVTDSYPGARQAVINYLKRWAA